MGVIYRLRDSKNRFYIGSTTNLERTLYFHRYNSNYCCSKKLCDDWTCDILEHTDKVRVDLLWLERKYFDAHYGHPLFVNEHRPFATEEEIKAYYEQNNNYEQNKAYSSEKIECDCGAFIRRDYKTKHLKTNKHLKLTQNKNI